MTSESKISVVSFKLEERAKRRFDAAMRAEGTTVSKTIRDAVLKFLNEVDEGVKHPQFRLDLKGSAAKGNDEKH
ncbi:MULTISPECIES: ribbon-helix-helix protein, CopG family [unclassified Pseudomonas]|uniref:ribbon-helix-helix protein, CopG family n=1 Tax=unclassified Pseudomonas TaxID=196821 RepID=UPI002AB3501E|nr:MULTISPECIES: ribbon-helix-helix protein, CopG family [unclassified Pseudomonas]MDY7563397.1 ribbon-helix-helix protein, CopG family [Pseudomonas sp. AB6]MEA9980061.1 ribbon-helix-helix protein, CopG family [Pseudomonas sp. RTS4]MEB0198137.1 ribbon-helix-helix protein, CopG family [Pseudomonas sp. 5S4]MEB0213567.1 ribbon-helix-helix protein, CopG family [Pseudomonas sp. AB6]MEB0247874.1 ribbon-helix-helix protein, CopG family [Pseudomonas sp. 10S5]